MRERGGEGVAGGGGGEGGGGDKPMEKLYGDIRRSEVRLKKLAVNYIVNRKK